MNVTVTQTRDESHVSPLLYAASHTRINLDLLHCIGECLSLNLDLSKIHSKLDRTSGTSNPVDGESADKFVAINS